jgi:hypothetical protein
MVHFFYHKEILQGCCDYKLHCFADIFQFDFNALGLSCQVNYINESINYFA